MYLWVCSGCVKFVGGKAFRRNQVIGAEGCQQRGGGARWFTVMGMHKNRKNVHKSGVIVSCICQLCF